MTAEPTLTHNQRLLLALKTARHKIEQLTHQQKEPIAIIACAGRFPGRAHTPEQFWQLLQTGTDAITSCPRPGWPAHLQGGFLEEVEQFDPTFFRISPREAEVIDPQHRLLLEVSWQALERAGHAPERLAGAQVGVFFGLTGHDYEQLCYRTASQTGYEVSGNAMNVAAGRVAYTFGLHGPTLTLDTACSSSLVAIHLACHSLHQQECDLALAGGVNLTLLPEGTAALTASNMLAADGRCKTFSAEADGYGRGEGCGVLLLRRLSEAIADGDHILALIRSSAVNQDGPSSALTVPNGLAQQTLIQTALQRAGLTPDEIDYIEAHGTGTSLGDPIEMSALQAVFGARPADHPLYVGSVKTNIGHGESAAGVAGVIKLIGALQQEQIPPHLHFEHPSPHINWLDWPLKIPTQPQPWPHRPGQPRRAGVSSFGFSGTNAHLILEEAPPLPTRSTLPAGPHLVPLSAHTPAALHQQARQLLAFVPENEGLELADIAFTLQTGRVHFNHRLICLAADQNQLLAQLTAWLEGQLLEGVWQGEVTSAGGELAAVDTPLPEVAQAYVIGLPIRWQGLYPAGRRVILPTYPFERQRYWLAESAPLPPRPTAVHPLLGAPLRLAGSVETRFEQHLSLTSHPFLADHQIFEGVIFPATGYVELALAAGQQQLKSSQLWLENLTLHQALALEPAALVQTIVNPQGEVQIFGADPAGEVWHTQATALVKKVTSAVVAPIQLAQWQAEHPHPINPQALYTHYQQEGIAYGAAFRGLAQLWHNQQSVLSEIKLPAGLNTAGYLLHPAACDACFQSLGGLFAGQSSQLVYLPWGIERLILHQPAGAHLWCKATLRPVTEPQPESLVVDLLLCNPAGQPLAEVQGLTLKRASRATLWRLLRPLPTDWLYQVSWLPAAPPPAAVLPPAPWLVVADELAEGQKVQQWLASQNVPAVCVSAHQPEQWPTPLPAQVVYLTSPHAPDPVSQATAHCQVVHQLLHHLGEQPGRLVLITHEAVPAAGLVKHPAGGVLWGVAKVIRLEYPRLVTICLDLDQATPLEQWGRTLIDPTSEPEEVWRNQSRLVARLGRYPAGELAPYTFTAEGSYLITGGLGGLGLTLAQWLVQQGAKSIILSGRRPLTPEIEQKLASLQQPGAQVVYYPAEVSQAGEVAHLLQQIQAHHTPLKGVFHAAGVVADAPLAQQSWAQFAQVLPPKIGGSWQLWSQTAGLNLDFFVAFSSTASLLGALGQGNYAAGNGFMDALLQSGPGLTINWGGWAEVGLAAQLSAADQARLVEQGVQLLPPAQGLALLGQLLNHKGQVGVLPADWARVGQNFPAGQRPPFLAWLLPEEKTNADQAMRGVELHSAEAITRFVQEQVAQVLRLAVQQVPLGRPLPDLGLDSLMAIELRNRFNKELQVDVPIVRFMEGVTVQQLAEQVQEKRGQGVSAPMVAVAGVDAAGAAELLAQLDGLSEAEMDELLKGLL